MSKRKNVPEIRFKGFNNAWEQRKLGDFIEDYIEKTTIQNQYPVLTSSQQMGIVLQEEYFANRQVTTSENVGYFVLPKGYFTYRSRSDNDVFVFNRNDLIDKGIISYFYPVFRVKNADSDFFLRRLNFGIERQISIAAEGTGQHVLSLKKFKDVVAMFPSVQEQTKIGAFFRNLDNLITLYQQKLDKLKELKKGYLDQMFTQKIRFKGFDGEWETLKSDEIFFSISEKNYPKLPVLSATQEKGMIYRDDIGIDIKYDEKNKKTFKRVLPGQFVIHLRSFQGGFAYSEIEGITSPAYTILDFISRKSHYPLFWKYVLTSNSFIKRLESVTYGIRDGRSISFSDFSTLKFQVPSYQEQKAIGDFLVQLEDTIILQELKLSKLNELKKAFLQKMFI